MQKQPIEKKTLLAESETIKAFLVGAYFSSQDKIKCIEHLKELKSLAWTFGLETVGMEACFLREQISSATYIGKGKALEIGRSAFEKEAAVVIFDEELSPGQQRNLEKMLKCAVIDRTELILGVFAKRAKSKEAKIQVQLAQLKYELPRLKRMWTHLSRQKTGGGGSGGYLKGEGERQIEIDRRLLKRKISELQAKIEFIKSHRQTQREKRLKEKIPSFAFVGYTNVGKSTLLKALTGADVLIEDKLFATLDTTTRKFAMPGGQEILLTDTVGFIRKLPHDLVASFRSTLEELVYADVLVHVIDVSHPDAVQQAESALKVIADLKADKKPIITVLNKVDQVRDQRRIFQFKLKYPFTVELSALGKIGFEDFLALMNRVLSGIRKVLRLKIPQSQYELAALIMQKGRVLSKDYDGDHILLEAEVPPGLEPKVKSFQCQ